MVAPATDETEAGQKIPGKEGIEPTIVSSNPAIAGMNPDELETVYQLPQIKPNTKAAPTGHYLILKNLSSHKVFPSQSTVWR